MADPGVAWRESGAASGASRARRVAVARHGGAATRPMERHSTAEQWAPVARGRSAQTARAQGGGESHTAGCGVHEVGAGGAAGEASRGPNGTQSGALDVAGCGQSHAHEEHDVHTGGLGGGSGGTQGSGSGGQTGGIQGYVALGAAEGGSTQAHAATAGDVQAKEDGAENRRSGGPDDARTGGAGGTASAGVVVESDLQPHTFVARNSGVQVGVFFCDFVEGTWSTGCTSTGIRGGVASAKMYVRKWAVLVQERGAGGSGNGAAQVVVGAGAPAQAGVQGRTSSVQVRDAASVGLCMAQDGASAGGRTVSAQKRTSHRSA